MSVEDAKLYDLSGYTDAELEYSLFDISAYKPQFTRNLEYPMQIAIIDEMEKRETFSFERVKEIQAVRRLEAILLEKIPFSKLMLNTPLGYFEKDFINEFGFIGFDIKEINFECDYPSIDFKFKRYSFEYSWNRIRKNPWEYGDFRYISPYYYINIYFYNDERDWKSSYLWRYKRGEYLGIEYGFHQDTNNFYDLKLGHCL